MSAKPKRFPPLPNKGRQGTTSRPTTPKKEVRNVSRGSSVAETLKCYDDQLEVISKFDEKIVKFEELLQKNEK